MPEYDFKSLSPYDFEKLMADIFASHYQEKFSYFKPGKDGGVDLAAFSSESSKTIAQCKHLAGSDFRHLISKLKIEIPKVATMSPDRYIVATSLGLSYKNKEEIRALFSPFILSIDDIWGKEDINQALGNNGSIERRHF